MRRNTPRHFILQKLGLRRSLDNPYLLNLLDWKQELTYMYRRGLTREASALLLLWLFWQDVTLPFLGEGVAFRSCGVTNSAIWTGGVPPVP